LVLSAARHSNNEPYNIQAREDLKARGEALLHPVETYNAFKQLYELRNNP
jgi:hypothetical protein